MRSYIENGVENVIENVISNVVENVIENALKTVALLTPLKTVQFLFKLSMLVSFTVQKREKAKIDFQVLHLEPFQNFILNFRKREKISSYESF
jgi:hypothetical protein